MEIHTKIYRIIIVFFIISFIVISSIKTTFDSYYNFYYNSKKVEKNYISKISDKIYDLKFIKIFGSYSGLSTGYGFFGPNVSSEFILDYHIYDSKNKIVENKNFEMNTKESNLRFMSMHRLFLDKITKPSNEKYNKLITIILNQIANYIIKNYPENYKVKLSLFLYDFPSIKKFNQNKSLELYKIEEVICVK